MKAKALVTLGLLAVGAPLAAQPIVVADSGDSAWVLAASLFAMLALLPGLALFYGRGRTGPTGFALFASIAIATLLFVGVGYSLIFSEGSALIGGLGSAFLRDIGDVLAGSTIPESAFVLFELVLALFAIAILAASTAERARLGWLLPFSALWLILVYVPAARWVWSGWLGDLGAIDYAGGIVIQLTAGIAALVIGLLLRADHARDVQHDSRIAVAGAALVWIGWLGVIGGSAFGGGDDAATAVLNAQIAASASVLIGMAIEGLRTRRVSVYATANNALAGLAAISAGATLVGPGGAMVIGAIAAVVAWGASVAIERLRIGSAAAAFTVHGAPAAVGAVVFPVFMTAALGGADFAEGSSMATLLAAQAVAVLTVALWSAVLTVICALMVSVVIPMKAPPER